MIIIHWKTGSTGTYYYCHNVLRLFDNHKQDNKLLMNKIKIIGTGKLSITSTTLCKTKKK